MSRVGKRMGGTEGDGGEEEWKEFVQLTRKKRADEKKKEAKRIKDEVKDRKAKISERNETIKKGPGSNKKCTTLDGSLFLWKVCLAFCGPAPHCPWQVGPAPGRPWPAGPAPGRPRWAGPAPGRPRRAASAPERWWLHRPSAYCVRLRSIRSRSPSLSPRPLSALRRLSKTLHASLWRSWILPALLRRPWRTV